MPLQFPSWAEPIEWLVGADWPHGNEDLMREMGRDLTDIADEIRSLIPELDGIISGLETVYPEGSGGERIVAWMKPLRDSSEGNNGSLQKFADNYDLLAGAADSMGDQIEAAKLNFYISFGWVLGELALALASGPFSPFSTAAVFASARAAFRVIANRLFGRIAAIIARIAGGRISAVAVKHVLMEGLQEALVEVLQGTTQELMVQTYQNTTGAVDGYDWNAVGQNAAVSAVAGGVGGLTGGLMGRRFDTSMGGWRGAFNGAVVGAGGGLGGAVAAGLMTGEWDPRSLTGGMFSGAGPGAIRGSYGVPNTSASNIPTTTVPTIDGTAPTVPSVDGTGPTPTPTAETDPAANPTSETSTPTSPASATDPAATNSPATSPAAGTSPAGNPTSEAGPSADPTAESNAATDTNALNSPAANAASETSPDKDTTATQAAGPVDGTESSPSSDPATNPATDSNANTEQKSPPATGDRGDNSTASNESGGPRESPGHTAPTSQQDSGANTDSAPRDAAQSTPDHGPSDSAGNDHTNHQDRAGTAGDTATDPAATSRGTTPTTTASPSETTAGPVGTHAMPSASESGTPGSPVQASSTTAVPNAAAASAPTSPSTAGQPASNTLASPATSSAQSHPPASTSAGSPTAAAQSPQSNAQNEVARARTPAASLSVPTDESRTPVAGPRASSTGTAVTSPVDAAPQAASPEIDVDQGTPTIEVGLPAVAVIAGPALDTPRTTPRTPWNGGVGEHRGTASPVADFHGDARPTGQPDLDMAQLKTEIGDNLRLITPEMMAFNRDGDYFVLPDGREIHLRIAPTEDGAVAEFGPHDKGYEIRVSPRARTSDVARAIAHELSEIALSLDPTIDIDPVSEAPTSMTTHLGGRFAELRVLLAHIDRATFDPARASQLPSLRHDLADLAAHLGLDGQGGPNSDLLREHDPRLARRLALEQDGLIAARPTVGPDTTDLDAGATDYDARLANLDGDFADSLRRVEEAGLQGRAREELARRVFDPLFTGPEAKAARATVPTTVLLDALDPINAALNDTTTTETERARAVDAAIDGFRAAMPDAFREVFGDHGFQRMHDAAAALGNQPRRITTELDHGAGTVDVDGRTTPFADFLHDVDRANRAATDLGIEVEYTVVVHDPVDGRSGVEILPRPRPQHRLPLPQNVFGEDNHRITHQPRPTAPAVAAGGHTIDVGVGRSAFGVEMTPTADRAGGGLIIKTELASEFPVAAQRRRDRGVLDPGPLTEPGTVMVFGDLLFNGNVLAQAGVGSIGRIFVNNVSAKFSPAQYDALAAALVASVAPGARIELQWDTKPESATGHVNDRGHIDGDQLLDALRRQFPDSDLPFRVEERTEFPPPGNNDYDYTIDAGGSNVLNRAKMAGFAAPRPDHRMVIVYEPAGVDLPDHHRGTATAPGTFDGDAQNRTPTSDPDKSGLAPGDRPAAPSPSEAAPTDPDQATPSTPDADTAPDAHHTPTSTAIGDDPATRRVQENLRNEGDFDVIFHADTNGRPLGNLTPRQIAAAIRDNPDYTPGTPIRLIACNTANHPDLAQQLADALGVPVHAATDAVGVPAKPNSPAHVRDGGTWTTHHPTRSGETALEATSRAPETPAESGRPSITPNDGGPVDYMGDEAPSSDDPPRRPMEEKLQDPVYRQRYYREYPDGSVRVKSGKQLDEDGETTPAVTVNPDGRWIENEGLLSRAEYTARRSHFPPASAEFTATPTGPTAEEFGELPETARQHAADRAAALEILRTAQNGEDYAVVRDRLIDEINTANDQNDAEKKKAAEAALEKLRQDAVAVRDHSENLGETAGRHAVLAEYPPSRGWTVEPLHDLAGINEGPKQGQFDQIYKVTDKDGNEYYVVYEAKGPSADLGSRGGHEQGTPAYFDLIIARMQNGTTAESDLANDLVRARRDGKLIYAKVTALVNDDGTYRGVQVKPFKM
ncbi:hypothetical protein OG225_38755 [Nocardia sp. NBC_01377]|uniref:WXG100-like domain-containing protein n=1 Tax=Nocardia sp. NBC_01377 TaxID=2903595 RepID=UPI00324AB3A5